MLQLADKEETIGEVVVEYLRHAEPSSRPSVGWICSIEGHAADYETVIRERTRNLHFKA